MKKLQVLQPVVFIYKLFWIVSNKTKLASLSHEIFFKYKVNYFLDLPVTILFVIIIPAGGLGFSIILTPIVAGVDLYAS